jgi:DNA invertase Pin-like site-specific DNA recombinase
MNSSQTETNDKRKVAAIYARVSSKDQNLDMQLMTLREYAEKRGYAVFNEYVDKESGDSDTRPSYLSLMDDARKRKVDIVLVWRFDRFARSTKALVTALDEFDSLGIHFISHQENIDTTLPIGKAIFTIISAIAQFEKSLIQDRVISGLVRAKGRGVVLGRPKLDVYRQQEIARLRNEGNPIKSISEETKLSVGVVHKYLTQNNVKKGNPKKLLKMRVSINVENNSKWTRGKKKAREDIIRDLKYRYNARPIPKGRYDYIFDYLFKNEDQLDTDMDDLIYEMHDLAEMRNCQAECFVNCEKLEKDWG